MLPDDKDFWCILNRSVITCARKKDNEIRTQVKECFSYKKIHKPLQSKAIHPMYSTPTGLSFQAKIIIIFLFTSPNFNVFAAFMRT